MSKAEELMIGDWVCINPNTYYNTYYKVKEIRFEYNEYRIFLDNTCVFATGNEIMPIPLTPEILEKNGFEKAPQISDVEPFDVDEEGNKHYSYNKTFWGWFQPDNIFCIPANGMGWLYIKYVHQLQHALRLCGIEKTIEL